MWGGRIRSRVLTSLAFHRSRRLRFRQVFDKGLGNPKVKASRLITKWKWRGAEETPEGQPQIIATQVLNNYLTPMSSSDQSSMDQLAFTNLSDPASVFKYKMVFFKVG